MPTKALKMIYYSYIYSHIIYLSPIWSGCTKYKLDQLYVLQKRALKYVLNVHWRHSTEELFRNEFNSLPYLMNYELLLLIFKITHNLIKHNFDIKKLKSVHSHNTRRKSNFDIKFFSSYQLSNNVLYKGLNIYNKLPENVKNINCISKFKKALQDYLPKII